MIKWGFLRVFGGKNGFFEGKLGIFEVFDDQLVSFDE
jgi:hypothetical protein